jgi:hypothetical protein
VEAALLKRALGFEYTETRTEGVGKVVTTERYSEPDVRAILHWLYNREPKRWRLNPEGDSSEAFSLLTQLVEANQRAAEAVASAPPPPPIDAEDTPFALGAMGEELRG